MTVIAWSNYSPSGLARDENAKLAAVAAEAGDVCCAVEGVARSAAVERLRRRVVGQEEQGPELSLRLLAAIHLLLDLVKQGRVIRVVNEKVEVGRKSNPIDPNDDRYRIREQLHVERDDQLRQESVRAFIASMEARRIYGGRAVTIYDLMRDGRLLAGSLRNRRSGDEIPIRPYVQVVRGQGRCEHTGLRLLDIWRYFRHTWSVPYKSVPGRIMMLLVRDAAAPNHPVIGIAALSSATVGLGVRDQFIGWTFASLSRRFAVSPSTKVLGWMERIVDEAIEEVFKDDLIADETITRNCLRLPTPSVIESLIEKSRKNRRGHYRCMQAGEYKEIDAPEKASDEDWEEQARSLLFRSKREQELANLLHVRMVLNHYFGGGFSKAKMRAFLLSRDGRSALTKLIRKAKSKTVGTAIADLSICGAVSPYNGIVGGKLVAMLATSPPVVAEYRTRYGRMPSIIASSMAGRAIVREAELVFISTTSLYGRRPNQYDRIAIPADHVVPGASGAVRYQYLGRTRGLGTFQFGTETVDSLATLLSQSANGQRINSVFGEGVNPRLRKIRDGLDLLGLRSDEILNHGAPRIVYGVPLITNLSGYLLGIERKPLYIFPAKAGGAATESIGRWWFKRWCAPRLSREDVLAGVESHTLMRPIRHGARVRLPAIEDALTLF